MENFDREKYGQISFMFYFFKKNKCFILNEYPVHHIDFSPMTNVQNIRLCNTAPLRNAKMRECDVRDFYKSRNHDQFLIYKDIFHADFIFKSFIYMFYFSI